MSAPRLLALALPLVAFASPVAAQTDDRADALEAVIRHALAESAFADSPRSRLLLDTAWIGWNLPDHGRLVARLVVDLGLRPGVSREYCRRTDYDHGRIIVPVGLEVRGVAAIIAVSVDTITPDSAAAWVSLFHGPGPYQPGGTGYVARRDSAGWHVEDDLHSSHGHCDPLLFTAPIAAAARAILDELDAADPVCLDAMGFPVAERDSVAAALGAEVRGEWMPPPVPDEPLPDEYLDPCGKADTEWGGVLNIVDVDWSRDDVIRVTIEGRARDPGAPGGIRERRIRYTARQGAGGWVVEQRGEGGAS